MSHWGRSELREVAGNCLKYLNRGWNKDEREEKQIFLKWGASWVKEWVP